MKTKFLINSFIITTLMLLMPSCGPSIYELTDLAPKSPSKGFALFYTKNPPQIFGGLGLGRDGFYAAKVYSPNHKIVGYVNRSGNWAYGPKSLPLFLSLLISNNPGDYDYSLRIGRNYHTAKIAIHEDSITYINLNFLDIKREYSGSKVEISYVLEITTETLPFTTNEGIDNLIKDLKDNDWEKRWLSTFLFGKIKEQRAYNLIKSNTDDNDRHVRFLSRKVIRQYNNLGLNNNP